MQPYYRRGGNVLTDQLNFEGVPGLETLWAAMAQQAQWQRAVLAVGWDVPESRREWLPAGLGHAIDFWTWRSLAEGQGLDDEKAALLMTEMVGGIAQQV